MNWHIHKSIIVISSLQNFGEISHKVISLLHQLKGSQEAVGGSRSVALRIFLEGDNPSIEEGNNVVPVEDLALEVHPFLWLFIILSFLSEAVKSCHHVVKTDGFGVRDHLVGMSASSLIDNCLVVEFF